MTILITREWAMPNKRTFQIIPIKKIIAKYSNGTQWADPFPYIFTEDATKYLERQPDESLSRVLFDPPYSPRQLKECYQNIGQALHDTTNTVWKNWKDLIAAKTQPNGIVISFGWNSCGMGKNRGFQILEIMLIAHGGNHNDTIVTIERKIQKQLL